MRAMSWYITLLVCGLFLIGVEIFLPGGVIGTLGALALAGAVIMGFMIFPPVYGWLSLALILLLAGFAVFIWMKFFPNSPVGKALSLAQNISKKDQDDSPWKPGMKGTALSTLRPSGRALIEGQHADVIADDGTWIEQNAPVEVVKVSGNRIYVRKTNVEG